MPVPAEAAPTGADADGDPSTDPLAKLRADIGGARGKAVLLETTAAGYGQGPAGAPRRDWEQRRIGAEWPDVLETTRRTVFMDVASACNLPAVLLESRAEGTSQREALRRWVHLGVEPMGALIAAELAAKLDRPGLMLDFSPLMASDLAGRGRFLKQLVDSGMSLDGALALSHLVPAE